MENSAQFRAEFSMPSRNPSVCDNYHGGYLTLPENFFSADAATIGAKSLCCLVFLVSDAYSKQRGVYERDP